ncbi:MAG TPA: DUF859 family phage minor structural protein [Clostridia bacterium]|nr:DUF859 family phage minor structural protein [Clostridia bacterium]
MIIYGSCSGSAGGRYNVWLDIVQNSQNITNNTSNITVSLKLRRNDGYAESAYNGYINQNTVKLTVNGVVVLNENMTFDTRNGKTAVLGTYTGNVSHDSDGKYSKVIKGEFTTGNSGVSSGLSQGTFTATTIPRASTLVFDKSSVNPTQDIKATITRASGTFLHTLVYSIGSKKTEAKSIAASHTFTVPQNFAEEIKSAVKGTVNVTLITYSGVAEVGRKSYSFSLIVPDNATYRPDFAIALTRQDNGVPSNWGVYVQGKSGVSVNISGTSYKYGATYKSVSISVDGVQKTALPSAFTLPKDGTIQISVKLTDTRGLSTTKTTSITVHKYSPPAAVFNEIKREVGENGAVIYFTASTKISDVGGKNTETVTLKYKRLGGSYRNAEMLNNSGTGDNITGECRTGITESNTYELVLTCTDTFGSVVITGKLGTELCAFNIKKGGKGAAFGKYAETDNVLEIDYDLKVNGRCDERLLWSGTLEKDQTCTLSDDLWNYRIVKFKMGTYFTFPIAAIYDGNAHIRATSSYANVGAIAFHSIRGVYTKPSNVPSFRLDAIAALSINTSGVTINSDYNNITEIWGIK